MKVTYTTIPPDVPTRRITSEANSDEYRLLREVFLSPSTITDALIGKGFVSLTNRDRLWALLKDIGNATPPL